MTRTNGRTAAGKLAAHLRTIADIDIDLDSKRRDLNDLGEATDWKDPSIPEREEDIAFWVRQNAENRKQLPLLRLEVALEAMPKGRYQGQEMTPVMKARSARAQARRAERLAAQQAAS